MTIADQVTLEVICKFTSLPRSGKPNDNEWTVLSAIVQENTLSSELLVVSLATGTKCLGRSQLPQDGDLLHDSHAEVLCRRAFLRYIHDQIQFALNENKNKSIFTYDNSQCKFSLQSNYRFHFYTSQTPCGDASIILKRPISPSPTALDHYENPEKRQRVESDCVDIHRTGAKCLEDERQDSKRNGIEYHDVGCLRYKPGRGDRTLSMSCSEKLSRWCYVGIQGAILAIILEKPIYLHSIFVGGDVPFCSKVLKRALFDRFVNQPDLSQPYELSRPKFSQSSIAFEFKQNGQRNTPSPNGIVWCLVEKNQHQVCVDGKKLGSTQKTIKLGKHELFISKRQLAKQFLFTIQMESHLSEVVQRLANKNLNNLTYNDLKISASDYQTNWDQVKRYAFKIWTRKQVNKEFLVR